MRKWFKTARLSKGLTQDKLAKLADVNVTTINKIELGGRRPSPKVAKAIAEVLDFDWTLFYKSSDNNQQNNDQAS